MDVTRRSIIQTGAWGAPVILAAVAAPAAAGSQPPPPLPVCVDPDGLEVYADPYAPWKTNEGGGFTTVKGDKIWVLNDGDTPIEVAITAWTSAGQEGVRLVGATGDTFLDLSKDGNRASTTITLDPGSNRVIVVVADRKDAEAHLIIGCDRGFILKSVR